MSMKEDKVSRLDDLKKEVAELEAQAKARQDGTGQQDEHQEPTASTSPDLVVKRVLDALLDADREQERQVIKDGTMHVCAACFLLQRKENGTCELCGDAPDWLVPSEAKRNPEFAMFMRMASSHS